MPINSSFTALQPKILEKIRPSAEQEALVAKQLSSMQAELRAALASKGVRAQIIVGGSTAKGTWLKGNHDIDIFVRFAKSAQDISNQLENVLSVLPDDISRVHGSRDYFQFTRGSFAFEIVPVLAISHARDAQNVTDMSVLHVTYISQHLTKKLRDDVRLAKQFMKAHRIYGAESYINGFSGHVLELLVVYYGGFVKFMRAVAHWSAPVIIDPEKHHKDPMKTLNEAKIQSPLILVDPVQPERNAAAAISVQSFERCVAAAKAFMQRPTLRMFTVQKITPAYLEKLRAPANTYVLALHAGEGKRDVVGTKCLKAFEYVCAHIKEFTILHTDFFYDEHSGFGYGVVQCARTRLPVTYVQQGPPLTAKVDVQRFTKKHAALGNKVVEKDGWLTVVLERKERTPKAAIQAHLTDTPVTSRVHFARVL